MTSGASSLVEPGGYALRLLAGMVLAAAVTMALFWTMQALISTSEYALHESTGGYSVDFVRVRREEEVRRKTYKPEKPPPPEAPPPEPPAPRLDQVKPKADEFAIASVPISTDITLDARGFSLGAQGEYLPIVKVTPLYPRRALSRGIEGHCVVEYTVTRVGSVKDVKVVEDECTSSLFRSVSVDAAKKFKYKPRIIDGQAVEVPGVRNQFTFRIEQ